MTAVTARPLMPNGSLYHSPRGLYEFQAEAAAEAVVRGNMAAIIDVGLGKTHIAMATAALLYELGEIDLVMHIARRNKIKPTEFPADWAEYTSLSTGVYHGTGRQKRLAKTGVPDVVVTTYETGAHELMHRVKKDPKKRGKGGRVDGPLVEALGLRGKRVLWIFDEVLRLGSRSNELWQSFDYILTQLRRGPHQQRVLGMTATPESVDDEQAYNIALIIAPDLMPPVTVFEQEFTRGRDDYSRYIWQPGKRREFATRFWQPICYRKRSTDPDVVDQLPRLVEKLVEVELHPSHRELYVAVAEMLGDIAELDTEQEDLLNTALRLTAGHPAAHLHSDSQLSRQIVEALGEDALRMIPSSKSKALVELLHELIAEGHQVMVFTWYANTVLPELSRDLTAAGIAHEIYIGKNAGARNEAAKASFKAGRAPVLLSSDAGAEGLNLAEAGYVIEYESAMTYERRTQRMGRPRRIDSDKGQVFGLTMMAVGTREENTLNSVLIRNARQDQLLGDTGAYGHLDARDRRRLLGRGH